MPAGPVSSPAERCPPPPTPRRRGAVEFLRSMSELFDVRIYTQGTRDYAEAVMGVLDPGARITRQKLVTRDECKGT